MQVLFTSLTIQLKFFAKFIDNSNASCGNLWQNGLHLSNSGKGVLVNNYVVTLNDNCFFPSFIQ